MKHFVYIVICKNGELYTGYSTNVDKRVKTHNSGKGAKYTKNRLPVKLVHQEEFETKSDALKREYKIKSLRRNKKLNLIKEYNQHHVKKYTDDVKTVPLKNTKE